jgi:hypothetical protein
MQTNIHASSRIRIHDPSVRSSEDSSCLRPRGHCDRNIVYYILQFSAVYFRVYTWLCFFLSQQKMFHWMLSTNYRIFLEVGTQIDTPFSWTWLFKTLHETMTAQSRRLLKPTWSKVTGCEPDGLGRFPAEVPIFRFAFTYASVVVPTSASYSPSRIWW